MKNTQIALLTAVSSLLLGVHVAIAQSGTTIPTNVASVEARLEDGKVHVSWSEAEDPNGIAYYRLYYSDRSILENGGDYDDYEQTSDNALSFVFNETPPYPELFISVLAVNSQGIESDAFESEAHVVIQEVQMSSASESVSSTVSSSIPSSNGQFTLNSAEATSLTGVVLKFSAPLDEAQIVAAADVILLDGSGTRLDVVSVRLDGSDLHLETAMQVASKRYVVATFGQAKNPDGAVAITLKQIDFLGFTVGGMSSSSVQNDTTPPEEVSGLRLVPKLMKNGLYTVFSFWKPSPDTAGDLASYEVEISEDGQLYTQGATLSKSAREAKHENIAPGAFGVKVRTKDTAGNISEGIAQIINLPQTGVGLIGITILSGFLAGRKIRRKQDEVE